MLYRLIKILAFSFLIFISVLCFAKQNDFYRDVAADAVEAQVNYYGLYLQCLNASEANAQCSVDAQARSENDINDLTKVQAELNEKIKRFYGEAWRPKETSTRTLEQARTQFVHEVTYLQKKILIFIANVEKKCGNPVYYTTLMPFMNMYIEDPSMLDEDYFKHYQRSNFDFISRGNQCKFYHQVNMQGLLSVYEIQWRGLQSGVDSDVLKSLYLYKLMENEMLQEQRLLKNK